MDHVRVEALDKRGRAVRIRVDFEEDLWTLKTLIRPGDLITARTLRDVKMRDGGYKERRLITVKLRVNKVEFQAFTGRLRVSGVIVEGPEDFGVRGRYHSLTISLGNVIVVEREGGWSRRELERMASSGPRGRALLVAIDYEEYALAVISSHGYKVLLEDNLRLPGKDDPSREEVLSRRLSELSRAVVEEASRHSAKVLVVVGPGDLKRRLKDLILGLLDGVKVVVDDASMGGLAGILEALRREKVIESLKEYYIVEAEEVMSEFMKLVASNPGKVAYGVRDVASTTLMGAVDKLVIVDSMLRLEGEDLRLVEAILDKAEAHKGRIVIIPEDTPVGERVRGLGGVIAVLRYPIPPEARMQVRL